VPLNGSTVTTSASCVSWSLLHCLATLARRAGNAILPYYGTDANAADKDGRGPVTDADRVSHRIIVDGLTALDEKWPIVSEESAAADYEVRRTWSQFWLVDPLDGTKEFLDRNPEFTVNIALVERERPLLGVVYAPVDRIMYAAACGLGAWRQVGDEPAQRLRSVPPPAGRPLRVVESRSHHSIALESFLATIEVSERVRVGSSLKFCRVAEGRADLYPRLSPIMEWDVAAGDCIYRCSGADADRVSPLRYNSFDLRIPQFVIGVENLLSNVEAQA
jgi:3'(2'), 5'-bisphosphate nucleotidase